MTILLRRQEDGLQFFREEKSDDAVFDVFLKKVQYAARVQTFPRSQKSTTFLLETADNCVSISTY